MGKVRCSYVSVSTFIRLLRGIHHSVLAQQRKKKEYQIWTDFRTTYKLQSLETTTLEYVSFKSNK